MSAAASNGAVASTTPHQLHVTGISSLLTTLVVTLSYARVRLSCRQRASVGCPSVCLSHDSIDSKSNDHTITQFSPSVPLLGTLLAFLDQISYPRLQGKSLVGA